MFIYYKNGKLITPSITESVLESITRDTVIKLAKEELGLVVEERTIDRTELYMCDEAFLCGSSMEITPVLSIDRFQVGNGNTGELTDKLHKLYLNIVTGKIKNRLNWLTPIY